MANGQEFEERLIARLRAIGHHVRTCEDWDHKEKIDGIVQTDAQHKRLKFPVEFQVTLRQDRTQKLERYLSTRNPHARVIHLYLEIETGLDADSAALHLSSLAVALQRERPYGNIACFGALIGKEVRVYDPYAKLVDLRSREADPAYARQFVEGVIVSSTPNNFKIGFGGSAFQALYSDVRRSDDRAALHRASDLGISEGLRVRFIRDRGHATDVRLAHDADRRSILSRPRTRKA